MQDSSLIRWLFEVLRPIWVNVSCPIELSLWLADLLLAMRMLGYDGPAHALRWGWLPHVMAMAWLLNNVTFLDLLCTNDFNLFVWHVVVVLISLHLIWLVALTARPSRRNRLASSGCLPPWVLVSTSKCTAGVNVWDFDLLHGRLSTVLATLTSMAREVLTPCLATSLIDVWDLLADTFRLITYIRIQIAVLIFRTCSVGCSLLTAVLLNIHHLKSLFLLRGRVASFG